MDASSQQNALDLWAPRRQLTLAQARRRSDLVRRLRMFFVAGAAIAFGLFAGHILKSAIMAGGPEIELKGDEIVTMLNPRFSGRDASGQAYELTAERAQRRRVNDGALDLVMPVLTDALGSEVRAPSGFFDKDTGILELYENVQITDAGGYSFTTSSARIYVREGRVEGNAPLKGVGPLGDIRSDSYEILEEGDRFIFKGNVHMTIYPGQPADETVEEVAENEG